MNNIRKEIFINAQPQAVWRHLADPALLAGWLMRNDFRAEPGESFSFWQAPSGNWDGTIHSELVEFTPHERMAFTWNANTVGTDTLVTIELEAQGEGCLVRLLHTNWEGVIGDHDQHYQSHSQGWDDHLWVLAKQVGERTSERSEPVIDWTRFQLYVVLDVPPAQIFRAWSTSAGLESFFVDMMAVHQPDGRLLDAEESLQAGCRYTWRWDSGALVQGDILAVVPGEKVEFTFGDCKVCVRLHPQEKGTLLELCQYDIQDTEAQRMHVHTNCRAAWVYFLTVLKTLLEHGVDGRDHSRATGSAFSTYFDPERAGMTLLT